MTVNELIAELREWHSPDAEVTSAKFTIKYPTRISKFDYSARRNKSLAAGR